MGEIQRLEQERDERRKAMEIFRMERAAEQQKNADNGNFGDVDYQRLVNRFREENAKLNPTLPHNQSSQSRICIAIRKRPINEKEVKKKDHDSVTCSNPQVVVHDCKFKVDGITKYLDSSAFEFDHTFQENDTTDNIYFYCVQSLLGFVLKGGRATVFAYGQTGSGKTYTMVGIQSSIAHDLFQMMESHEVPKEDCKVFLSFFEIYGGRCQDLLNNRNRLNIREDGNGEVVVSDLIDIQATCVQDMLNIIDLGNQNRTTHATESNDESSRSHALCQISLKIRNKLHGRLSLIDLAGSERGSDTQSNNRQRRMEGAEINKSLLALKECIRALDSKEIHVPYRASKLTLVLKDSFTRANARTVMIATVSPAASSADHTINTLRYADRVKERKVGGQAKQIASHIVNKEKGDKSRNNDVGMNNDCKLLNGKLCEERLHVDDEIDAFVAERSSNKRESRDNKTDQIKEEFARTVESLFDNEEELLNLHMNIIQENAELLTEEGRLLQSIQGDDVVDYDIDAYCDRLAAIIQRKQDLNDVLRGKLQTFKDALTKEEELSSSLKGK